MIDFNSRLRETIKLLQLCVLSRIRNNSDKSYSLSRPRFIQMNNNFQLFIQKRNPQMWIGTKTIYCRGKSYFIQYCHISESIDFFKLFKVLKDEIKVVCIHFHRWTFSVVLFHRKKLPRESSIVIFLFGSSRGVSLVILRHSVASKKQLTLKTSKFHTEIG